jgi:DNA-binding NtrC family response regulator
MKDIRNIRVPLEVDYYQQWMAEQVKPRRLLLVDDSMDDCVLIQRYTYPYHCEWIMANSLKNAQYALDRMKSLGGFSLIFLDLKIGSNEFAGAEVFQVIKKQYPEIPIVILSGHLSTESIAMITRHGFAMFAQKPESFTDLYFKELFRIMNIPLRPMYIHEHREPPSTEPESP